MDIFSEEKCLYCGTSEGLVDAVTNEEVIKLCGNCAAKNGFPVIVKASLEQINASNRFYNKSKAVSVQPAVATPLHEQRTSNTTPRWVKHMKGMSENSESSGNTALKTESLMSQIARAGNNSLSAKEVEKTVDTLSKPELKAVPSYSHAYSSKIRGGGIISGGIMGGTKPAVDKASLPVYLDLIDNFHWHIMHGRRLKKISQKQLAEMLAEKEENIVLAEQGKLPEDYSKLVSKLEQFLNIKIRKKQEPETLISESVEKQDIGEESETSGEERIGFFGTLRSWWRGGDEDEPEDDEDEPGNPDGEEAVKK